MRKSNWIVFAILLAGSFGFALMWYFMGFDKVHSLDLVLSFAWWALIALAIVVVMAVENKRRKAMRTTFIGRDSLFNPRVGTVEYSKHGGLVPSLAYVLNYMDYGMNVSKMPGMDVLCVVHTDEYSRSDLGLSSWKGNVVPHGAKKFGAESRAFNSREQLESLVADI